MRILFTGGGGAGNEAIWRKLHESHDLFFADANPEAIDPIIPLDRRIAIPFARDAKFAEALYEVCIRYRIDILVPGVDEELIIASEFHSVAPFKVLLPSREFVELMLDKLAASHAIAAAGLSVPETRPISNSCGMQFPLIAKPRSGRGSRGVMKLDHPEQIKAYLELQGQSPDAFIAQELARGQEYTVFVAADEYGQLRAVVPVKVLVKRGITINAVAERHPLIVRYVQQFQSHFQAAGLYNLQCTVDEEGQVWPFEINPRISTTFCLALESGYSPFSPQDEQGLLFEPSYPVSLQRHWKNDFIHKCA